MDKIKFKQFLNNLFFYFSLLIKVNINKSLHTGRALVLWVAITVTKMLPVQHVIRTFLERKLLRLEPPYPRSCMDNLRTNLRTNGGPCSPSLAIAGSVKEGFRVRVPLLSPNISDLAPKTVGTNADKWLICGQIAYNIRRKLRILLGGCLTVKN